MKKIDNHGQYAEGSIYNFDDAYWSQFTKESLYLQLKDHRQQIFKAKLSKFINIPNVLAPLVLLAIGMYGYHHMPRDILFQWGTPMRERVIMLWAAIALFLMACLWAAWLNSVRKNAKAAVARHARFMQQIVTELDKRSKVEKYVR